VVWNPWRHPWPPAWPTWAMATTGGFVCVETANAADEVVTVPPGSEHRMEAEIGLSALNTDRLAERFLSDRLPHLCNHQRERAHQARTSGPCVA
jgi:hypothetical protein